MSTASFRTFLFQMLLFTEHSGPKAFIWYCDLYGAGNGCYSITGGIKEMPHDCSINKLILIRITQPWVGGEIHQLRHEWMGLVPEAVGGAPTRGTRRDPRCASGIAVRASGYWCPCTSRSIQAISSPTPGPWCLQKMRAPALPKALPPLWGPGREGSKSLESKPLLF